VILLCEFPVAQKPTCHHQGCPIAVLYNTTPGLTKAVFSLKIHPRLPRLPRSFLTGRQLLKNTMYVSRAGRCQCPANTSAQHACCIIISRIPTCTRTYAADIGFLFPSSEPEFGGSPHSNSAQFISSSAFPPSPPAPQRPRIAGQLIKPLSFPWSLGRCAHFVTASPRLCVKSFQVRSLW
jgi:hypothetical protein